MFICQTCEAQYDTREPGQTCINTKLVGKKLVACGGKLKCRDFKPDHNGECLNCDDWADEHRLC